MRHLLLLLALACSSPALALEPSCSQRLATALAVPESSPSEPDWNRVQNVADVSIQDAEPVTPPGGAPGFLFEARCVDDAPKLVWWAPGEKASTFRLLLEPPIEEEESWDGWSFLTIEKVDDLDGDGMTEAFVVATGGAGMYYHWPMLVRIDAEGARVLYAPEEPFFYGRSQLLPSETPGKILLSVRAVDRDAPWAFAQPSVGLHPVVDHVLEIAEGQAEVRERHPVANESRTLSDFVLAVRSGLWREASGSGCGLPDGYTIRNPNTRHAYAHAVSRFLAWAEERGLTLERKLRTRGLGTRTLRPPNTSLPSSKPYR